MQKQPWIHSAFVDGVFIIGTPFLVVAATLIFAGYFGQPDSMTFVSWAILVMGVDVSHVYSTIYRTYLDRETMQSHGLFLFLLPFAVLIACIVLYSFGALVFWRVMAYVAVFHFVRQQYGFLRVYARHEQQTAWQRRIDATAIYTATLYPIVDWHLAGQKNFNWFMKGDFVYLNQGGLKTAVTTAFIAVMAVYVVKELHQLWKSRAQKRRTQLGNSIATNALPGSAAAPRFNIPRNGILLGTLLSWYVGIVHFNSDLAFTAINVMSHGIPYIALVWIYGNKKHSPQRSVGSAWAALFRPRYVALFVVSLLILAFLEEGLWDAWVWHNEDHRSLFAPFHAVLGGAGPDSGWLKLLVPLLSVPQITHYVIDGFIWKIKRDKFGWRQTTLS
ncbi:MAG: hypothetical protein U1F27_08625 [Turneriella sp.]